MKIGILLAIGVISSPVEISAAGQLSQRPVDARHEPSMLQQTPGSPLVAKEERKPFDHLFMAQIRSRWEKRGPVLLDSVPTPTRRSGPCGLVFLDERRDIDPRMIVPVPPGDFAIRRTIPDTCRKD
jgi:hypothetical protein